MGAIIVVSSINKIEIPSTPTLKINKITFHPIFFFNKLKVGRRRLSKEYQRKSESKKFVR